MAHTIGLTLGDPVGIGPELWVRLLCGRAAAPEDVRLRLFGDAGVLERAAANEGLLAAWQERRGRLFELTEVTRLDPAVSRPGQPTSQSGAAQVAYLESVIAAARAGEVQGICTAPIHKASAHDAGLAFPGHTELLGARLASPRGEPAVMMLAGPSLRVALATIHIRLAEVPAALTVPGLADVLVTTARALHGDFGIAAPRLWVAGLNPHAGESGHFGDEEARVITPAIAQAAERLAREPALSAVEITGPLVPDVLFRAAIEPGTARRPDAIVAMYHDQGLIPLKLLDFDQAVNVTLGLRVIRTSPDHGVAHDIAGRRLARPASQAAALDLAIELVRRRAR